MEKNLYGDLAKIYAITFAEDTIRKKSYMVTSNILKQGTKLSWDGEIYRVMNVGNINILLVDEKYALVNVSQKNFETLNDRGDVRFLN
ncbi:hypothetical protein COI41_22235 [Bacillus toyonensis]|uniref:hypothetical protein n=1 Tax=Bacillus toyonensis TaxID=155322 RepID=UPI000BFD5742|nr:hypothetical protein [Bacillus toyonensis]PHF52264.1 hypothetical protein COI41_22235 [Bacillus toyonensis]